MKKLFFFSCGIFLAMQSIAQLDPSFTYSGNGVFYKTFKQGGTVPIPYGSYIEYTLEQFYNDSLLADTKHNKLIMSIDSAMVPKEYVMALAGLSIGDSIVYKASVDTNMEMYSSLPWVRPGSYFGTHFKIERIFANKEEADATVLKYQREADVSDSLKSAALIATDSKKIEEYLNHKNIKYIKTPAGVYISIIKKGAGNNATDKSILTVNYTGKTFGGTVFDSNTDPAFQHVTPLEVDLNNKGALIKGWEEGLLYFNTGSKGMLYIPSPLGFGASGSGMIGPNEITMFDIEVISIKGNTPPPVKKTVITTRPKPKAKTTVKKQ